MSETDEPLEEQPLLGHLIELRQRLIRIFLSVLVVFLCLFYFANDIYDFVSSPLQALLPENSTMIATEVTSPFFAPFKLTLMVSVMVAIPYILYQIWGFVAPGLYRQEKRMVLPLLGSSVLLFYLGVAFAYFVVFPLIFGFFTTVGPQNVQVMTDISSYLDFVLKLFFAFGFAFEIPIAVVILCWMGISDPARLAAKRPWVLVACFVVGMLLTPPDIISQSLLAVPMWLLFEVGILCGRLVYRKPEEAADDAAP